MKQPESRLVIAIKDRLQAEGGWWVKIHGGPFQEAGIPDIIGCYEGIFVGIEVKMPNNRPSGIQKLTMNLISNAGGRVGVAYSLSQALQIRDGIENWSRQKEIFG